MSTYAELRGGGLQDGASSTHVRARSSRGTSFKVQQARLWVRCYGLPLVSTIKLIVFVFLKSIRQKSHSKLLQSVVSALGIYTDSKKID